MSFLKLPQEDISNLIITYLVGKKIYRQYKKTDIFHNKACVWNEWCHFKLEENEEDS